MNEIEIEKMETSLKAQEFMLSRHPRPSRERIESVFNLWKKINQLKTNNMDVNKILEEIDYENKNRKFPGGTRKIADHPKAVACLDQQHNPPMHQVFSPGIYQHVCPTCGHSQIFVVPEITV